jgi:hypothetical protein
VSVLKRLFANDTFRSIFIRVGSLLVGIGILALIISTLPRHNSAEVFRPATYKFPSAYFSPKELVAGAKMECLAMDSEVKLGLSPVYVGLKPNDNHLPVKDYNFEGSVLGFAKAHYGEMSGALESRSAANSWLKKRFGYLKWERGEDVGQYVDLNAFLRDYATDFQSDYEGYGVQVASAYAFMDFVSRSGNKKAIAAQSQWWGGEIPPKVLLTIDEEWTQGLLQHCGLKNTYDRNLFLLNNWDTRMNAVLDLATGL